MAGELDVDGLKDRLDSVQFATWVAFEEVDPGVEGRLDIHFSLLSTLIASIIRDPNMAAPDPTTFLFNPWRPEIFQTPAEKKHEVAGVLKSIFATIPGVIVGNPEVQP